MGEVPTIAYSYARISTKKQERGSGIQRQMKQSREYAAKHGLVLDETLRDIGVSAFTGDNLRKGALGRFRAMVEEGHITPGSYLLVESLDRLSRDKVRLAMPIFLEIINAGIVIITLGDGDRRYDIETMDENPYLLMGSLVVMTRGNEESAIKRFRTSKWWEGQIALARTTPGHKVKGQNPPGWLNADWSRNEPVIAVVEKAFDLAANGMGAHAIAKHLNAIGAPTLSARKRSGGGWYQST
ncbi:recombinase family protein [Methylorubrum sp. SL192]|uniref:recombinase family protein n=1 Tax=Methylorubrum sp. SL192 TaxID=2995167 RepID=UPI00227339B9|nr:recombinase family protein [Methylorubrum sp. SL192]MCY1641624.1 recombinase family protein [Methylorubrum sp. SL192]